MVEDKTIIENDINYKTKYLTLVLTHQCNLSCVYCYEKHKDHIKMSLEKATQILDYEMNLDDGFSEVEIDLFGGEPLLCFNEIKALVEYAKEQHYKKPFIFFITTNGVLLDDEKKKWFKENTDTVQMSLSLDGTRKMHNINRSNSYDKIDIAFFRDTYPFQKIKMTVSNLTLNDLAEGVIYCHKQGFKIICDLAYGIDWTEKKNTQVFEKQLMLLIDYYIENPTVEPFSMFNVEKLINVSALANKNMRMCGAGFSMKDYDCDGICYPCQHFLPISVGEEKAKESLKLDLRSLEISDKDMDNICKDCILKNICPTCYGANFATTGNIYIRDKNMCELFKIQCKALSYFAVKLFEHNRLDFEDNKKISILNACLLIDKM